MAIKNVHLKLYMFIIKVQLILGQHRLELQGRTYMQIFFFNSKYYYIVLYWLTPRMGNHKYGRISYMKGRL